MTIKELIEALESFEDDAEVYIFDGELVPVVSIKNEFTNDGTVYIVLEAGEN